MCFPSGSYKIPLLLQVAPGRQTRCGRNVLVSSPPTPATAFFLNDAPIPNIALCCTGTQNPFLSVYCQNKLLSSISAPSVPRLESQDAWGQTTAKHPLYQSPSSESRDYHNRPCTSGDAPQGDFSDGSRKCCNGVQVCILTCELGTEISQDSPRRAGRISSWQGSQKAGLGRREMFEKWDNNSFVFCWRKYMCNLSECAGIWDTCSTKAVFTRINNATSEAGAT